MCRFCAVLQSVYSLVFTRALYNAVSLSVFNPARELLWLPFNASDRAVFKSFVYGPFRSLSRILGAVLTLLLTTDAAVRIVGTSAMRCVLCPRRRLSLPLSSPSLVVSQPPRSSADSAIMTAAAVAWFVDAFAARQSYAAEFYASLRQGYLDLTSPLVDFTPDQVRPNVVLSHALVTRSDYGLVGLAWLHFQIVLVKETLVAGAQNQVNYVLSSLSHEHIGLFAQVRQRLPSPGHPPALSDCPLVRGVVCRAPQELRALFYKTNRDGSPVTPLHTKLRLLGLHTAAKRQSVLLAQESYFVPDASTFPSGVFNTMDLMMLVKDKSVAVPRQLRVAAILACGYERYNADAEKCYDVLSKLVQSGSEDKSVVVCAAVALLRLSDWMDEEANVVLQRLLHDDKVRVCGDIA